ncbi:hypothetical protein [Paenibacillus solani]|uniref:hypothetical protein n=1 Tax=Paenibacillus solani TaxID=1705565 RepID=UPI003D29C647
MMISEWIHIECIFINKWVLPIQNEINEAIKISKIEEPTDEFYESAMAISIRIDMIIRLFRRMTEDLERLNEVVIGHKDEHVNTNDHEAYGLYVDDDLKLDLLIDIDAFLFEINSCCELLSKFIIELFKAKGQSIDQGQVGRLQARILRDSGIDASWFKQLDDSRNFFIHNGAPYIAVDVTNKPSYNLIIMKENLKVFDDLDKFLTLTTLVSIRDGFLESLPALQKYLIEFIKQ